MAFPIKKNDTSPSLLATLQDGNGAAIDLTGASVRFLMRQIGSSAVKVDAAMTVTDASAGSVRYDWQAGDTDTSGSYQVEFEVTYAGGGIETFPNDGYQRVVIIDDID